MYNYFGAFHIHSSYSDGTKDIKKIVKDAKKAGLSFVVITDHNTIEGMQDEGYYDGVAVIVGQEISPSDSDHYLALGLNQVINQNQPPLDFVKEVKSNGGFGYIAHPDESFLRENHIKPLRWKDWSIKDFGGLEIWNYMSNFVDNHNPHTPFSDYVFRDNILTGPTQNIINWWDGLNNESEKIIPAIAGCDAHCFKIKKFGITFDIFPYITHFKTLVNQIHLNNELSSDFNTAKNQILNALEKGNLTLINRNWGSNNNKDIFSIETKNQKVFAGETIEYEDGIKLKVNLNKKSKIKIIHDGQLIKEANSKKIELDNLWTGKYRVEVYFCNKPWIFTNPIIIN